MSRFAFCLSAIVALACLFTIPATTTGDLIGVPNVRVDIPTTLLSVNQPSLDNAQWGNYWTARYEYTNPNLQIPILFKWLTREENLDSARWQLSRFQDFHEVSATGVLEDLPSAGRLATFRIDMAPHFRTLNNNLYLRVVPRGVPASSTGRPVLGLKRLSNVVQLTALWPETDSTTFDQLPKLTVVFDRVLVIDDSDDLSAGDLGFAFFVHNQDPGVHLADVDSGKDTHPNLSFKIENPPPKVMLRVVGFDNDNPDFYSLGPLPIFLFFLDTCYAVTTPSDECQGDGAEGVHELDSGMGSGQSKPETPFRFGAYGPKLKFEVEGRYWLRSQ